ncbi:MAG: hypothetical protein ABL949_09490 [Fimbriimonadaceae bacterium]
MAPVERGKLCLYGADRSGSKPAIVRQIVNDDQRSDYNSPTRELIGTSEPYKKRIVMRNGPKEALKGGELKLRFLVDDSI